ncbi:MAG: hypothetical protein CL897_06070 [Dehalococcoidia bacterium]|nr:hypothetical protein [Dehalococcoidia bacterium]|tara:strand:- start:1905 stop:2690 length:786 start_codon:yes stop_codon:yes gene_type:complete
MGLLDGKKAIILGASSGIGWAIAERFAEHGADLIVAARRLENLEKLAAKTGATPIRCDGRNYDELKALADAAVDKWGGLDIAVNSAGIVRFNMIRDITPVELHEVADIQYFGFIYFMKHMGNAMADSGGGSLINITSSTAISIPLGLTPYSAAKAAINFATKIAAREYGPDQVRVNAVAPGFVPTAMNGYGGEGTPIDEARVDLPEDSSSAKAFIEQTPLARITTVDDCANVALAVASDLFSDITGQVIPVEGGNHLLRLP